jgi:hypothetical protein
MINAEKVYDDYLYDCHIANKRLTPEEWQYYGREEHHIEIPDRDGGLLTPCNSQYLTRYQHWIAGILQSEVLQKCCFSMVPKRAIPPNLEKLRKKWVLHAAREGNEAWLSSTTPEERSVAAKGDTTHEERSKRSKDGWAKLSEEQRQDRIRRSNVLRSTEAKAEAIRKRLETMTPEKRSAAAKKAAASQTPEQRSQAAKQRWAKLTPEERRLITKKGSEAAAKKAAERKAVNRPLTSDESTL